MEEIEISDAYVLHNGKNVKLCCCSVKAGNAGAIVICVPRRKVTLKRWRNGGARRNPRNKLQVLMSPKMARQLAEKLRMLAESIEG